MISSFYDIVIIYTVDCILAPLKQVVHESALRGVACEIAKTFVSVEGISGITLWYQLSVHVYICLTHVHMQQVCEELRTQYCWHGTIGQ